MLAHPSRLRIALVFLSMMTAGGCAVGTAFVSAPPRLPSQTLPELARPIRFDVCEVPESRPNRLHPNQEREAVGERMRKALRHAGVRADLTADAGSPVDFTVSLRDDLGSMGSAVVSFLTLSLVPGYVVQRKTLNVDIAGAPEHLQYQARTTLIIWLPLIVSPDIIMSMSDGLQTAKIDDGGFRQMVGRLGDDLRARLGHDGGTGLPVPQTPAVKCGNSLDHAASRAPHPVAAAGLR